jgi:phosphoribosyl 1,2-cyclic phosphate phosphodiesterase
VKITVLGSGTSTGTPVPGCKCGVCCSTNPKNTRLRPSVAVESSVGGTKINIVIDTGPDFRYQSLRAGLESVDAVLYTHAHADHIFGMDDLRGFNFILRHD